MKISKLARIGLLGMLIALLGFQGCGSPDHDSQFERGHSPWVFRSVLDWRARMITIALRPDFWVAYDAGQGSIYKLWQEGVELSGAVFDTQHGPQPVSKGSAWFQSPHVQPWKVKVGESILTPKVQYRGHRFEKGQVILQSELILPDGSLIVVNERPEYTQDDQGNPGLERVFHLSGLPDDATVMLATHLSSLASEKSFNVKGGAFEVASTEDLIMPGYHGATVEGTLQLSKEGETILTTYFTPEPFEEEGGNAVAVDDEAELPLHPGAKLIEGSDCKTCHNEQLQTVGPSYQAIAEKYTTSTYLINKLASKIINGGNGVWGEAMMLGHPDLTLANAQQMVAYILTLDGEPPVDPSIRKAEKRAPKGVRLIDEDRDPQSSNGLAFNLYQWNTEMEVLPTENTRGKPNASGWVPQLHLLGGKAFRPYNEQFYVEFRGYLEVPATNNYLLRLKSDDGGVLRIDGEEVINHDGIHPDTPKEAELYLEKGKHRIEVDYFQAFYGLSLELLWANPESDGVVEHIPAAAFSHDSVDVLKSVPYIDPKDLQYQVPGDQHKLAGVHPSFHLQTIRPEDFQPKVAGLDLLADGRVVLSTWDSTGSVYIVSNFDQPDRSKIKVKRIAEGLAEPLGLKVVGDELYLLQKQELTQLIDHDGDEVIDEYRTLANNWQVSSNFHEFAFGLVYKEGFFYATLATAIEPGGASTQPQIPDRGKAVKINAETGELEFVAHGLRTPNGVGLGVDEEVFIADNQGDWLPANKIVHLQKGAFYGSRSVDPAGTANMKMTQPLVWLPQDEIGNSPSQPASLNVGPYQNQMIHGEVTHGGLKRVFVEKVDGQYQGAVFRFSQGIEGGVNRIAWGPDDQLYIGCIGNPGNWSTPGGLRFGLQRMKFNGESTFEMLAVRAKSDGMEIEFTEPLKEGDGFDPASYEVQQWRYVPTEQYGGPKVDPTTLPIREIRVSEDRKKVFLKLSGMKPEHLVYIRLKEHFVSQAEHELWSSEAWYTLSNIPQNQQGFTNSISAPSVAANQLTAAELAEGWKLLFDGESLEGWRKYKGKAPGNNWRVENGAIHFSNRGGEGGDIITDEPYENFELSLEWKIQTGSNSGIIYHVVEDEAYDFVWQTGPEMQVLDNQRHPDGQILKHRAGDLYDLIQSKFVAVKAPGEWNRIRIISVEGKVQHWLNGHKVVEYDMNSPEWAELIAGSKFSEMPGFGKAKGGHISLQDHSDPVWFRNIKIRTVSPL